MSSWSFRRRIKIIPGVRLNLSKNGISTSIGVRGASLTFGKNGTYLNAGLPGTGIYKRQKISGNNKTKEGETIVPVPTFEEKEDNIFSIEPEKITSQDMEGVKQSIIDAHKQRIELANDIKRIKRELLFSKIKLVLSYLLILNFWAKDFFKKIVENIDKQKKAISDLENEKNNSYVDLDVTFDEEFKKKYEKIFDNFNAVLKTERIWDITREEENDMVATRSNASRSINRKEVKFSLKDLEDIKYEKKALHFQNANGADLYFYPNFIVMQGINDFGVVALNEIEFNFGETNFVEQDKVPSDTEIIDYTWFKVNKNGTPDKRFKDNYKIPIVKYGNISLKTNTGINEEYQFSNYNASEEFANSFLEYQQLFNQSNK